VISRNSLRDTSKAIKTSVRMDGSSVGAVPDGSSVGAVPTEDTSRAIPLH
jgi:hypothetical protein